MDKMRKEFEDWWKDFHNGREIDHAYVEEDNSYTIAYANAQWVAWQASKSIPDRNILVNKGDYVELVKTNRERQETIARLTEEVKIIRERKKFYKNKCKASSIHEGFVVVPREPKEEIVDALEDMASTQPSYSGYEFYSFMIEAVEQNDE